MDVRKTENSYSVFSHSGSKKIKMTLDDIIKKAQEYGAGEIFLNSINRDGSKKGFDIKLIKYVKDRIDIPLVACGGVGTSNHFLKALDTGVSGLAAGNFFHFTEHSTIHLKSYLMHFSDKIRLDTYANYKNNNFGLDERLSILSDEDLEKLKFDYIPQEKI